MPRLLLTIALSVGLSATLISVGCQQQPPETSATYLAFGTRVDITIRNGNRTTRDNAAAELGRQFQRQHRQWHPWQAGELMTLNRALREGGWTTTTPELLAMLRASQRFERDSLGHFNPAIGELVSLWGFHTSEFPITAPPPAPEAIRRILDHRPSSPDIELDNGRLRTTNRGIRLDFSGLAKGHALALACERLTELELDQALINAGGDVLACGADPDRPWRVAITDIEGELLATIELSSAQAVFSSGNRYRYLQFDGQRHAHILDPWRGRPVDHVAQATVIDEDPVRADAAATALVVAGPDGWQSVARAMGVTRVIMVFADGQVAVSDGIDAEGAVSVRILRSI